jgi:hypothetical protein
MHLRSFRGRILQLLRTLEREERKARLERERRAQQLSHSQPRSGGPVRKNSVADSGSSHEHLSS